MYEGYSENNLLINREEQQYNFHDSVVINPINLNPSHFTTENLKAKNMNAILRAGLGSYQDLKLTKLLSNSLTQQNNIGNLLNVSKAEENRGTSVIQVVSIDEESNFISVGPKFAELMKKYSSNDVAFISLIGQKMSGKSFFYDKVLNLAEVRGNNFCQKHKPAIYTYSTPFVKDGLYIFIFELGGCALKSQEFKLLNSLCLILSSAYIVMTNVQKTDSQQALSSLKNAWLQSMKILECENSNNQANEYIKIRNLFYISRNPQPQQPLPQLKPSFEQSQTLVLPNALIKGNKQDLTTYSFLAKEYINPNYIKRVSEIFKQIYGKTQEKKIKNLIINGNITVKILLYAVNSLNSKKQIQVDNMYAQVLKELYVSAYNFCVMLYHEELERYFQDQLPKNSDEMYQVFQQAAENALNKFDEFNLEPEYHDIYQNKLMEHIDQKEQLLNSINKQKTKQYLEEEMNTNKMRSAADLTSYLNLLQEGKKQLDDGRVQALKQNLTHIFSIVGGGSDDSLQRQLEEKELRLLQEYEIMERQLLAKENLNKKKMQQQQRQEQKLRKEEIQVDKEFEKLRSIMKSQINEQAIEKMKKQVSALKIQSQKSQDKLRELKQKDIKKQIADACSGHELKIKQAIQRQKQLQKQIDTLRSVNKQTEGKPQVSKMKSSEQKPTQKAGKK